MEPCTPEMMNAVFDNPQVAQACEQIAQGLEEVKKGTRTREDFEEMKSRLKADCLPVFCFHASFPDGHRSNQSAVPSGLSIYDVDHLPEPPRQYYDRKVAGREAELGICLSHITPSSEGLRLVFQIPRGMDLAGAQQWMARQLGDEQYDGCVKDLARCSFGVPRSYVLYYDEQALFAPRDVPAAGEEGVTTGTIETIETINSAPLPLPQTQEKASPETGIEDSFEGISYSRIVAALEEQLGGVPARGARNNFIFAMSCHLRYVCNDNPEWIAAILPRYGEEEPKFLSTVRSACNRPQTKNRSAIIERALAQARRQKQAEEAVRQNGMPAARPPQMPAKLPRFIRLITRNVPAHLKPAVAMAVFPALGAHCYRTKFRYNDNALVEPTFMNILVSEMSSGKSCVNEPIDAIMADIKERDDVNRRQIQEWKEKYAGCPANEQKPERPRGLPVQWVKTDMTPAAFVQLMADAGGHFLYSRMDELGLLNQLKTNGRGNNVTEIIRLSYDCGEYGQERVGTNSVAECVEVRWNWNASTTPGKLRRFLHDSQLDGTLSRITFSTIHTEDDRMPVYGIYDETFREQVQKAVEPLVLANGIIVCRKANELVEKMIEENSQYAALADDEAFRELSYRATCSAFKRAMILYLLNNRKWTPEIEEFVRWSFQYDMWCKMWLFGESLRKAMEQDWAGSVPGRRNLMECLPDSFTLEDLNAVRHAQGMKGDGTHQLQKWVQRGYCTFDPATGQNRKSPEFLLKHAKRGV